MNYEGNFEIEDIPQEPISYAKLVEQRGERKL